MVAGGEQKGGWHTSKLVVKVATRNKLTIYFVGKGLSGQNVCLMKQVLSSSNNFNSRAKEQ